MPVAARASITVSDRRTTRMRKPATPTSLRGSSSAWRAGSRSRVHGGHVRAREREQQHPQPPDEVLARSVAGGEPATLVDRVNLRRVGSIVSRLRARARRRPAGSASGVGASAPQIVRDWAHNRRSPPRVVLLKRAPGRTGVRQGASDASHLGLAPRNTAARASGAAAGSRGRRGIEGGRPERDRLGHNQLHGHCRRPGPHRFARLSPGRTVRTPSRFGPRAARCSPCRPWTAASRATTGAFS